MLILKPGEDFDRNTARVSIFLAGPTPRDKYGLDWRPEAISFLVRNWKKYITNEPVVFSPAPFLNEHVLKSDNYYHQIDWEDRGLECATVILFWVPRDLGNMPGFTTNVEFGAWVKSGKVIYGRPPDAPKCGYLDWHAKKNLVPLRLDLESTVKASLELLREKIK